jgi:fucose permease
MLRPSAYWGFIVLGIAGTLLGPALLPILSEFHASPSQSGELFFASSCGYVFAVLVGGPAGDRWSRGLLLRTGAVVLCLGLALVAVAPAWALVAGSFFVLSIGSGIVDSGSNALVIDISAPEAHAREQNLLHAFFGFGALIGPLLIGAFLAIHGSWRAAFAVDSLAAAVLFILYARAPMPRPRKRAQKVGARSVAKLALSPQLLTLGAITWIYVGAEVLLGDWSAAYMQDIHRLDKVSAAASLSLYWGGLAVGRLMSAYATRWLSGRAMLVLTCVFSLGACTALVFAPNTPVALIALAATGLGYAAVFPLAMAAAGEIYADAAGSVAGLLIAGAVVFGAVVPWIGGVLVQFADARAALALSIPSGIAMVVISWVLYREPATNSDRTTALPAVVCE